MATNPNLPGCDEAPATRTPARLEQRGELLGRRRRPARRRRRASAVSVADLDEGVDGDGNPVGTDDQRVDVDAAHVGALDGDPSEPDEHGHQGVAIDRRLAAELAEQALGGQLVDHLVRRDGVERRRAEHDVGDGLGQDPAETEHDGRAELRVAQHAGDQLAVAPDHRRDEHVDGTVGRASPRRGARWRPGGRHRRRPRSSRTSPRSVLWAMASPFSLATTGNPSSRRRGDRVVGRCHASLAGQRDPVAGEQLLRLRLGQRARRHRPVTVPTQRSRRLGGIRGSGSAQGGDRRALVGDPARAPDQAVGGGRVGVDGRPLVVGDVGVEPGQREAHRTGGDRPDGLVVDELALVGVEDASRRAGSAATPHERAGAAGRRAAWPTGRPPCPARTPRRRGRTTARRGRRRGRTAARRSTQWSSASVSSARSSSAPRAVSVGTTKVSSSSWWLRNWAANPLNQRSSACWRRRSAGVQLGEGRGQLGRAGEQGPADEGGGVEAGGGEVVGRWRGQAGVHVGIRFRASVTGHHASSGRRHDADMMSA